MAGGAAGADVLGQFTTLTTVGVVGGLSDAQLLQRFLGTRDGAGQAAFAALVERHGPMVLRVCLQVLGNPHDAQDAFQATFLVLARRAGSVRRADSVASWLHGVALRVAARARADAARRRAHERRGAATRAAEPAPEAGEPASWAGLHAEVARLPARYREPVVLCYLEGLTTEAAAVRIGCPRGTVLSRLSRARARLRGPLARRGLAPAGAMLASGLAADAAAALPASRVEATVRAALGFAGRRTAETASASAAATTLARGVLHAMTIFRFKVFGTATLAGALALGGVQTFGQFGGIGGGSAPEAPRAEPKDDDRQDTLRRKADKIQAELIASVRRTAELRKLLEDVRAELNAPRVPPTATATTEATEPGARTLGHMRPGDSQGVPGEPRVTRFDNLIIATSPEGERIAIHNRDTGVTSSLRLPASKEAPLEVTPVFGTTVLALSLKGQKITKVAAANAIEGRWYTQELREPAESEAVPTVRGDVVVYGLGRYAYAFSPQARRWDVVELPPGVKAEPLWDDYKFTPSVKGAPIISSGKVTVKGGGHIFTFNSQTGKWIDFDLNAILKTPADEDSKSEK